MLHEAVAATGLDVAAIIVHPPARSPRVDTVAAIDPFQCPIQDGDRLSEEGWLASVGARTVTSRRLDHHEHVVLFALDERPIDESAHLAVDVVAHFLAQHSPGEGTAPHTSPEHLRAHLLSAIRTRDLTGNGISVARGWLDHLATGTLDGESRGQALDAAHRRLADVQAAVDAFIESTTTALVTGTGCGPVDLGRIWRAVSPTPLTGMPREALHPVLVAANEAALEAFLSAAAGILVPEVIVMPDHARLPLTDAGRLDGEARPFLRASLGELVLTVNGAFVQWRLARESHVSDTLLETASSAQI